MLSWLYAPIIRIRNVYYDKWAFPVWLEVPVISIGNITVGGTGKTPMTIWLCKQMLKRGRKPAVLSRGYKAGEEGVADEILLIGRHCPKAVAIANPNRQASGQLAVEHYQAKAAVLDDGFQHRRLGRDLDIVLIDATHPFGYGYILPRGLLREPIRNLKRAEAIIITRCDQSQPADIAEIETQIRRVNPQVPIVHAIHKPVGFADLDGNQIEAPSTNKRIGCFAGIARPDAFIDTMMEMNIPLIDARWWPDHHDYNQADVESIANWTKQEKLDCLITTEKDAVKLHALNANWPVPVVALGIEIELLNDGEERLNQLINTMLANHEEETNLKPPINAD